MVAGGVATVVAGLLFVYKGAAIATSDADPDVTSFALLLFAAAPASVALRMPAPRPPPARLALGLSALAAAGAAVAAAWFLAYGPFPGEEPLAFRVGLTLATFASLVALAVVGWPAARARVLPGAARWLPFATGLGTMPLIAVGFGLPDEGLVAPGLLWVALGAAIAAGARAASEA